MLVLAQTIHFRTFGKKLVSIKLPKDPPHAWGCKEIYSNAFYCKKVYSKSRTKVFVFFKFMFELTAKHISLGNYTKKHKTNP